MALNSEMAVVQSYIERAPVDIIELIKALGVEYSEEFMEPGSSGRIDYIDGGYRITVNVDQSQQRKKFTAAHELAHYLLHRDLLHRRGHLDRLFDSPGLANPSSPLSPSHEVEANKLAASILMPRDAIKETMVWADFDLRELADQFGVSPAAMEIRLKVLGIDLDAEQRKIRRRVL